MPNLETEEEAAKRIAKTSVLNKFNDKIDNFDEMFKDKENEFNDKIDNFGEMFKNKENKLSTKLNKLNNNIKKHLRNFN